MTELAEMQFELLPSVGASDGFVFGIGSEVSVDDGGFVPGGNDWFTQDADNPTRGSTAFGRDHLKGPTWAWSLHVNRSDKYQAVDTLDRFATAWRSESVVENPGLVVPIRYRLANRVRRVYGRPRRYDAPPSNLILSGYVPVTVDFKCIDPYTYDDSEKTLTLSLQQGSEGGFTFPTVFPAQTLPVGTQADQAVVGGTARAHPVVRFNGPVAMPSLETDDWSLSLDMEIAAGQYVVIDTRPWPSPTALLNGVSSVAGFLGRRQWLSRASFTPGRHEMLFRGASSTGGAECLVTWRDTYDSI